MMEIDFDWNPEKEEINYRKHGISFQEATTVLEDLLSWTFPDPDHSGEEQRYLTMGVSSYDKLLVVSHTDRESKTRIISARKATKQERRYYEETY